VRPSPRIAQAEKVAAQLVALVTLPGARAPGVVIAGDVTPFRLNVFERDTGHVYHRCKDVSLLDLLEQLAGDVREMRATGSWWRTPAPDGDL
jgi:hypothetical protein